MSYPDEDFSELRTLLSSKRYEQPPPAYFVNFSDRVIARIETEESPSSSSWWSWLLNRFDAKPVFVCVYSVAVSSLLFVGFRLSEVFDAELTASASMAGPLLAATPASPLLLSRGLERSNDDAGLTEAGFLTHSASIFREAASAMILPASWPRPHVIGFPSDP